MSARTPAQELADALATAGLHTAAAVIHLGLRHLAPIIEGELAGRRLRGSTRALYTAQVTAWGRGDDEALAGSMAAWEASNGCEACALRGLTGLGRCPNCEADAVEAAR